MRKNYYDEKVKSVKDDLATLFDVLFDMIDYTNRFIISGDKEITEKLFLLEEKVDQLDEQIEVAIMELLMIRQPEYNYMKFFLCLLRAIKDLERIGDQTINFVKLMERTTKYPDKYSNVLIKMNEMHGQMLNNCWEGIQNKHRHLLDDAILLDEKIDYLHMKSNEQIVNWMEEKVIDSANGTKMIVILRFLERLGDNIVNVCETYIDYFYKEND